ncbi:MAG: glycosyltransferase family 2 protein [Marinobacterium sp.]|nr:glycosyltransferase family 2 protein [Marinobacterium sp.]
MPELTFTPMLLLACLALLWWLVLYHHLFYPLLLRHLGSKASRPNPPLLRQHLPTITVVIPAFNEASVIKDKIRNLGMLDYPAEKLDIILACDGCTDHTADRAVRAANEPENRHLNVRIWAFPDNVGKTAHLNRVLPLIRSDITALSDASALISRDALLRTAAWFQNPEVGVVAGSYQLARPGSSGEHHYWQYQRQLKLGEGLLGAPIGVHGALWSYRSLRFKELDEDIINDDFVLPMQMVCAGNRAIYDPEIIALELECAAPAQDMKRRSRIAAGNLQQLLRLPGLLNPALGGVAFAFASGKALRALMPLILLAQWLLLAVLMLYIPTFATLLWLQSSLVVFSALMFYGWGDRLPGFIGAPCYLVCGYMASLRGVIRYLLGLETGPWQRI